MPAKYQCLRAFAPPFVPFVTSMPFVVKKTPCPLW